jgi:hypothetical protein
MAGKDLAATFTLVIDLEYDNSEIKQSVLDHTEATYDWVLKLFNLSVSPLLSLSILRYLPSPLQVPQTECTYKKKDIEGVRTT